MKNHLTTIALLIEDELTKYSSAIVLVAPLQEAFSYALFPKGKRIRPALALALTEDLIGSSERFVRPALALELIHASSLVHDDLPALDNDDFRRGKPSCHKAFGEATAILTGDLMIAEAFALAADPILSDSQVAALTRILSTAFRDLCHGQQCDIIADDSRGPLEQLHRLKTGALFRASAQFGAIFSNLMPDLITEVASLGENIGLLFQMNDDLLDLKGDSDQKGRPQGSDQRNQRQTYGSEYQLSELFQHVAKLTGTIAEQFSQIEQRTAKSLINTRLLFENIIASAK
jgi:geranylgeranyl diphosphate synthase type II